jgi:hypothetical protein
LKVDLNVSITLSALETAKILKVEYNMEGTKKGRKLRLSWERKNLVADSIYNIVLSKVIGVLGRQFLYMYEVFGWTREEGT